MCEKPSPGLSSSLQQEDLGIPPAPPIPGNTLHGGQSNPRVRATVTGRLEVNLHALYWVLRAWPGNSGKDLAARSGSAKLPSCLYFLARAEHTVKQHPLPFLGMSLLFFPFSHAPTLRRQYFNAMLRRLLASRGVVAATSPGLAIA